MKNRAIFLTPLLSMLMLPALGVECRVQLLPSDSTLTTTITLQLGDPPAISPPQVSALSGALMFDLALGPGREGIVLRDFRFQTEHGFDLDWDPLRIVATNVVVYQRARSDGWLPELRDRNIGDISQVPFGLEGVITYSAEDSSCALLRLLGVPCPGAIDLAQRELPLLDRFPISLVREGSSVRLQGTMDFGARLLPDRPEIGKIEGKIVLHAAGEIPPSLTVQSVADDGQVQIAWLAVFQRFRLERSEFAGTLASWSVVELPQQTDGDWIWVRIPSSERNLGFYRLAE